jgi:hypothetical protein
MADMYFETQVLTPEIDTGDDTLGGHTNRRLYFIYTDPDGEESEPDFKAGLVTESSVMYAELDPLEAGTYRVWAESDDTTGNHCVSEAFLIPASARGTVRPT